VLKPRAEWVDQKEKFHRLHTTLQNEASRAMWINSCPLTQAILQDEVTEAEWERTWEEDLGRGRGIRLSIARLRFGIGNIGIQLVRRERYTQAPKKLLIDAHMAYRVIHFTLQSRYSPFL
jgi:hypothetical protein